MAKRIAIVVVVFACARAPVTGRREFIAILESDEIEMGLKAYQEVKQHNKVSTDPKLVDQVTRVAERIARAADAVAPDVTRPFKWEFTVLDDPKTVNAFCLPGGKIAVYSGMFPVTQDDIGLAVVLGHEVSHALARHGAERISRGLVEEAGMAGLNLALGNKDPAALQAIDTAYALGMGIGFELPFSRRQEGEADHIGLIVMATAGYDPHAAVAFWKKMISLGGEHPPVFLSDHPADEQRLADIEREIPEAMKHYQPRVSAR